MANRRRPRQQAPPEIWSEHSAERAFFAPGDMLKPAVTLKAGRRVLAVRRGFIEALLGDPRVVRLLDGWIQQLVSNPDGIDTDDVIPLVANELGLGWPWVIVDIMDVAHRMVMLKIADPLEAIAPMDAAVLAPPLEVWFMTEEGEGTDEARERWAQIDAAVRAELDAADAAAAGGSAPKNDDRLKLWGQWYYEARVASPRAKISEIARRHFGNDWNDRRKDIRDSVKEAARLLSLHEYTLPRGEILSRPSG